MALELEWNYAGLNKSEIQATEHFTEKALNKLPEHLKSHLNKKITINYVKMTALGESRNNSILLSDKLKEYVLLGPNDSAKVPAGISSKHKTMYDMALGTLLHEISHQYDFYKPEKLNPHKYDCMNSGEGNQLPPHCAWTNYSNNVSDNPQFLYSIPWQQKKFNGLRLLEEDDSTALSPNAYEFKNPAEAFAVNFEFFLLDPEFKCRRPTVYNFLAKHFSHSPFSEIQCQNNFFSTTISNSSFNGTVFEKIDATRVAAVHYLLAGDGDALMSSWGHSMIRLVICAPERTVIREEDCINDIAYHRVVSYRAAVADLSIDNMKGLFGEYASKVYLFPLLNVINEYTKLELRDLTSYPLQFSRQQIIDLVERIQQQNWSYRGKYYFSNNNCATETFNLIKHVVPEQEVFASLQINTPKSLRNALFQNQLSIDPMNISSRPQSYFWPSKAAQYQKYIDQISKVSGSKIKNIQSFYNLQFNEKQKIFNVVIKENKELTSMYILLDLLHEKLINKKNSVMLRLEQNKKSSLALDKLKQALDQQNKIGLRYFNKSYGIPTDEEITNVVSFLQASEAQKQESMTVFTNTEEEALKVLGEDFKNQLDYVLQSKKIIKSLLTNNKGVQK